MQLRVALAIALLPALSARAEHLSAPTPAASAPSPPEPPGQEQFLGCEKYPTTKKFKWSVRGEVGVSELAASLGQISCQPIVLASGVAQRGGKVQLEVPDLVTAPEVYRLFYAALEALGLTVDPAGGVLRIVDGGRAREVAVASLSGEPEPGDRFVVRLYRPEHASPSELAELFGKLKSHDGEIDLFGAASLVIIDRANNVRRMEELGHALDVAEPRARIYTLPTHGQSATDLAAALEKILSSVAHHPAADKNSKAPTAAPIDNDVQALVPLDSARLLAVVGTDAGWQRVQAIAERIDPVGDDFAQSQGHVINLLHTNAEDIAQTLQTLGLGGRGGAAPKSAGAPSAPSQANAALPLSGEVRIAPDKVANALVVFANGSDFNMVRDLVQKLDVPRRQVYVEAVILDLSVDKERNLGLVFHQGVQAGSSTGFVVNGSQALNSINVTAATVGQALGSGGLMAGILGQSINIFGQDVPSFGVMLQALEQDKDVNVISRPHLLTMDNTKASISVGQNIVYQTAAMSTVASAGSLIANYQRTPVALTLELTPHLNDSDAIRLEINGTIEDVADSAAQSQPGGPTTNERKLTTAVVIKDGEPVVLGGLQKESDSETVSKIPFLGDIPLLGKLFSTHARSRIKQDLLIVLTPYIIRGPDDLRRIERRKEQERQDFIERYTAFSDEAKFEAHVDYRRKRGLLAEIDQTARSAEVDAEALRQAERTLKPQPQRGVIAIEPQP